MIGERIFPITSRPSLSFQSLISTLQKIHMPISLLKNRSTIALKKKKKGPSQALVVTILRNCSLMPLRVQELG